MLSEYAATMPRGEIVALATAPFVVGWVINRAGERLTRRPRVYDWQKDPKACADLYSDEALAILWRAIHESTSSAPVSGPGRSTKRENWSL